MAFFFTLRPSTSSSPFSIKLSHIRTIKIHNHHHKISCKCANNDQESPSLDIKFDRRNMLCIGLGGLYNAATLASSPFATATPIPPPNINECTPTVIPNSTSTTNCCPPTTTEIIDFKLPPFTTMSVRPAAHLVDEAYISKYNKAIELMRALPGDDPRNFMQQANVHCTYCVEGYHQPGSPNLEIQIHQSWLFYPWHRYYLYFFEKICQKLIDDPTFALPFWNWDSRQGMTIPSMYTNINSALYDRNRDKDHMPPAVVDFNYNGTDSNVCPYKQMETNLKIMYRNMVSNSKTPKLFLGSAYRLGDEPNPGGGFYSAARDPLFFAHHGNVDRMWSIWKTLGGRRHDISDPDFLDASFLFYDENAKLVRVNVKDCLDEKKLGYVYADVEIPWLNSRPKPGVSSVLRKLGKAKATEIITIRSPEEVLPSKLDKVLKVMVKRPKKKSMKEKDEVEEVLVIRGIELEKDVYAKFDVYINDNDDMSTPENTEFGGSFVNVPHGGYTRHGQKKFKTQLRLSITDILEDLDAEDDDHVLVTLIPTSAGDDIKIDEIKIELDD
ncbi:hypothetical protein ACJIZ3_013178 [Penstemon smallii]|uniref:Tyrosinase copper-binding domain-containing protein n=1 Tax=Penstemon smallii TaxID=265156 RepID=A0ABD3UR83_9LAMI